MRTLAQLETLSGRVALVTGAAGHLGRMACDTLRELGATVAGADRVQLDDAAATRISDSYHHVDLSYELDTRTLVNSVLERHGRLDVLVHSAAFVGTSDVPGWAVPFPEQSVAAWDMALRVNLTSAFILAQEAAPALRASTHGTILFVSSIYGMLGPDNRLYAGSTMANPAGYGASKAALELLGRHLATVLAPGIRVNTLSPGGIERGQPVDFQAAYCARTPLQRMATEEDFKGAIAFLCSDLSAYVTGHTLVVDGGWSSW